MVAALSVLVFAGALTLSVWVMALAVGPQWRRIGRLALGMTDKPFTPLARLAVAEQRIAVRRWASLSSSPVDYRRAAA